MRELRFYTYVTWRSSSLRCWTRTTRGRKISAFAGDRITFNEMVDMAKRLMCQKWEATYEPINRLATREVIVFEQPEGSYNFGEELREATADIGPTVLEKFMDARVDDLRNMDFPNVKPVTVESNESW
ncbi:hypothetical protein M752DRAFT_296833 [Aspergillus phoenicis ATCC 13157]|uniref:NmrA-like domain-containing protein n=1 Tax=Aspergillus phoenicis ATCC 13157 TaxID=1353007 RepID=A0A370P9D6_ASPPH|nr:hypothetical protein M752DRAFT_296833 [Aspergillus phoenicis ATCC 13157]